MTAPRETLGDRFGADPALCPRCQSIKAHRAKLSAEPAAPVPAPITAVESIQINRRGTVLHVELVPRADRTHVRLQHSTRGRNGERVPSTVALTIDAALLPVVIAALEQARAMITSAVPVSSSMEK